MTSKLQPYLNYKESGIEWIKNIPIDWQHDKIASLFTFPNDKVSDVDFEPLSVTYGGVKKQVEDAAKTENGSNRKLLKIGDIAFNGRSDRRGACGASDFEGSISVVYHVLRKKQSDIHIPYFHHLFRNTLFSQEFYRWGKGIHSDMWMTRILEMKRIQVPVPPIETQKRIADFLDEKTKIIDELILKKEKMIGLLREKRAALITRAVTKGLDSKAKMKPSGVDWLGDIPEGWQICRLGQVGLFSASGIDKKIVKGESMVKIINYIDVYRSKDFRLINKDYMVVSASKEKIKVNQVNKGDLIFTPSSEVIEEIGLAALVDDNLENTAFSYHVLRFQFQKLIEFNNSYKKYLTNNLFVLSQFSSRAQGSIRKTLSRINFKEVIILVPSLKEQKQIADYLDTQSSKIDRATEILKSQNKQLKEYRSSLIYSAVTGKIKV